MAIILYARKSVERENSISCETQLEYCKMMIKPGERDEEWIMLGLRTARGLDPAEYEQRFSRSFSCFLPFLEQCRMSGYSVEETNRWRLTPKGFLLSNRSSPVCWTRWRPPSRRLAMTSGFCFSEYKRGTRCLICSLCERQ